MIRAIPKKHFDTSGKSPAQLHSHTICKTPIALPGNGPFGAIAGKKSFQQLKLRPLAAANDRLRRCHTARACHARA
jgi:hypothetical protein